MALQTVRPDSKIINDICRLAHTFDSNKPSEYMSTLTTYLSNIMNSVLLGLPTEIKELIYFDALSHAATMILVSTLSKPLYLD